MSPATELSGAAPSPSESAIALAFRLLCSHSPADKVVALMSLANRLPRSVFTATDEAAVAMRGSLLRAAGPGFLCSALGMPTEGPLRNPRSLVLFFVAHLAQDDDAAVLLLPALRSLGGIAAATSHPAAAADGDSGDATLAFSALQSLLRNGADASPLGDIATELLGALVLHLERSCAQLRGGKHLQQDSASSEAATLRGLLLVLQRVASLRFAPPAFSLLGRAALCCTQLYADEEVTRALGRAADEGAPGRTGEREGEGGDARTRAPQRPQPEQEAIFRSLIVSSDAQAALSSVLSSLRTIWGTGGRSEGCQQRSVLFLPLLGAHIRAALLRDIAFFSAVDDSSSGAGAAAHGPDASSLASAHQAARLHRRNTAIDLVRVIMQCCPPGARPMLAVSPAPAPAAAVPSPTGSSCPLCDGPFALALVRLLTVDNKRMLDEAETTLVLDAGAPSPLQPAATAATTAAAAARAASSRSSRQAAAVDSIQDTLARLRCNVGALLGLYAWMLELEQPAGEGPNSGPASGGAEDQYRLASACAEGAQVFLDFLLVVLNSHLYGMFCGAAPPPLEHQLRPQQPGPDAGPLPPLELSYETRFRAVAPMVTAAAHAALGYCANFLDGEEAAAAEQEGEEKGGGGAGPAASGDAPAHGAGDPAHGAGASPPHLSAGSLQAQAVALFPLFAALRCRHSACEPPHHSPAAAPGTPVPLSLSSSPAAMTAIRGDPVLWVARLAALSTERLAVPVALAAAAPPSMGFPAHAAASSRETDTTSGADEGAGDEGPLSAPLSQLLVAALAENSAQEPPSRSAPLATGPPLEGGSWAAAALSLLLAVCRSLSIRVMAWEAGDAAAAGVQAEDPDLEELLDTARALGAAVAGVLAQTAVHGGGRLVVPLASGTRAASALRVTGQRLRAVASRASLRDGGGGGSLFKEGESVAAVLEALASVLSP